MVPSYHLRYCLLVQSTFNSRMDTTVELLQYSVDYLKFEAKNRSALIII